MVHVAKAHCPQGQDMGLFFQRLLPATEPNLGASLPSSLVEEGALHGSRGLHNESQVSHEHPWL